jgi:hypothetical protein
MASIPGPVNPENYKIGICCFSAMHTALRSESKDNVSECRDKYMYSSSQDKVSRFYSKWLIVG